jgi:hypothetical protein
MITGNERSDLIHIMKMNRLSLADSDSVQFARPPKWSNNDCFTRQIMSTTENRQIIQDIFSELSKGNDRPLIDAMSEDMQWNWMGIGR